MKKSPQKSLIFNKLYSVTQQNTSHGKKSRNGVVYDALTGRVMDAEEALRHGVVSRVVPDDELDDKVLETARHIASAPAFTVKMFRRTLQRKMKRYGLR